MQSSVKQSSTVTMGEARQIPEMVKVVEVLTNLIK